MTTIVLRFDPFSGKCEFTAQVFRNASARTLYLLWRRNHIVGQDFSEAVLSVAKRIDEWQPRTAEALFECFKLSNVMDKPYSDFVSNDVRPFCLDWFEYFTGKRSIGYRVELADKTQVEP